MDTGSFICQVKIDDIYKDIAEDVERRFDASNFEIDRPLPKGKNKKSNWNNGLINQERICWIKSRNVQLFKRQQ